MATLNLDYYTQADYYSDGDIENKMLDMARNGLTLEDMPQDEIEFPLIYHFSDIRTNILCWYPIKKSDSVLEIGAGCGAVTGMLCEKAGSVTSIELSKRRAEINFERNRDKDNLTIMVGNMNDMEFSERFDYVVVNGVLEYAIGFTEGENPYHIFLKKIGGYLKKSGKLLIAIENKIGLKYFSGAPEDHTDLYFFGINRYPDNHSVRTFSKEELCDLLNQSGFSFLKYYYPYPDYKFPTEIFTDKTLYSNQYGKEYPIYKENTIDLFSESAGIKNLTKERILDRFVNSFLVVASKEELLDEKILYVKLNQGRKKQYRTYTEIVENDEGVFVRKKALTKEAVPFVRNIENIGRQELEGEYKYLPCEYSDGLISYPFLTGHTLQQEIKIWVEEERLERIEGVLDELYNDYFQGKRVVEYQSDEFREVFGSCPGKKYYECIAPANVDIICSNVFAEISENYIIDYEWTFQFPVPVQFIMWRLLHDLYNNVPQLDSLYPKEKMMERYGILYSDSEIFLQWTLHFVYKYVGSDFLDNYKKNKIQLNLSNIVNAELKKNILHTKLYYDTGCGLNEKEVIEKMTRLDNGHFSVTFDLSEISGIKALRWNPSLGRMCRITIDELDCGCNASLIPWGPRIEKNKETIEFLNQDAFYFIQAWNIEEIKKVKIEGRISYLDLNDIDKIIMNDYELKQKNEAEKLQHANNQVVATMESGRDNIKKKAKRLIKRILKLENGQSTVMNTLSSCVGSIDHFQSAQGSFNVIGWVFDNEYPLENPHISIYSKHKKIGQFEYTIIYRKDVAQVLENPDAEASGFAFAATVQTSVDLDVFFEYDTPAGRGKMLLGTVPGDNSVGADEDILVFPAADTESIGNIRFFTKQRVLQKKIEYSPIFLQNEIDIIIPIYNGYEYFDALFSSIEKTRMRYRLILVDDNSPDERVTEYLDEYKNSHNNVILLRNETNLGFVKSVNRALKIAENHVALVNSDVEVPEEWLERLMYPIIEKENVATATPFTNCGTICSFPNFCEDNELFENMPLWKIDNAFSQIKPFYPAMPTGIGFCMGMNIQAIHSIGLLDAESFGRGYAEENDWCQRAIEAGYKNVHVDNMFVYHKHGGSFPSEEKQMLLENNTARLSEKHPNYNRDTAEYCRRDPSRTVRLYVMMNLLSQKPNVHTIVAFDHNLGGGATEYLNEKRKLAIRDGHCFIIIRYDIYGTKYVLEYKYKKYSISCQAEDLGVILSQIKRADEIWINELVTYPNLFHALDTICTLKKEHQAYLKMLIHDFFALCPAINLMDNTGKYCNAADENSCNCCIPENRSNACLDYESGSAWRKHWNDFLMDCDEVLAFSDDSAEIFRRVYPKKMKLRVIPHKEHFLPALNKRAKTTNSFNIGLLGVLCYKKGLNVIKELVKYIEDNNLNVKVKLIGVTDEEINSPVFSCTGRYSREQLPRLTLEEDVDMFLIPSIWPETFSYTTSEIMSMNMPIAVFPIGAPVERVMHYEKGIVLSATDMKTIITEMLNFAESKSIYPNMPINTKRVLFIGEEISFASRYRVEHFREQLIYNGYGSDFKQIEETQSIDLKNYDAIVFYRCNQIDKVKPLVQQARDSNIQIYYDIDDLVFDYDKISYLKFLQGSEYTDFRNITERTRACMELCDKFFTSTNSLADEIKNEFPEKEVVINRNCASMEMQVLSHDAVEQVEKASDKIYIGYFSGSKTHDQDFEVAERALISIMEKYPQVHLKVVGVMSEKKLKGLQKRTEKYPFMEWQKLPEMIAGIHINLMPLEDSIFHCCKSENKWMEAALVKVPSIMSRNIEIESVIENGKTALLCSTEKDWVDAMELLVTNPDVRHNIGENAFKVVMEKYVTQRTGNEAREELLCIKDNSR